MNIIKTLLGLVVILFACGQAHATGGLTPRATYSGEWSDAPGQPVILHSGFASREDICRVGGGVQIANYKAGRPNQNPAPTAQPVVNSYGGCDAIDPWWGPIAGFSITENASSCPTGTTGPAGSPPSCSCPAGSAPNVSGSACVPENTCTAKAGKMGTQAVTIGWSRVPPVSMAGDSYRDTIGPMSQPGAGSAACVQGCSATFGSVVSASSSATPTAQGTYRLSGVYVYTVDASPTVCTSDPNAPNSPTAAPRACDGYAGTVSGVPTCVLGSGGSPVPATPPQPPTFGNPKAGSDGALPIGDPAVSPPDGNGGPGGGPPHPKDGSPGAPGGSAGGGGGGGAGSGGTPTSGGSGTPADPYRAKDPCGLPGTPACKFDETGTGNGVGALAGAATKFDAEAAKQNGLIATAGSSVTKLPWAFSFTLPTGGCTVFHWGRRAEYVLDPCSSPWIAIFRSLMAYMFFGLAGFYMWKSTVSGGPGGK